MADDSEFDIEHEWLRNLPLRSEEIGFAREEMSTCGACGKPNAPNRNACLYCGGLIASSVVTRLEVREAESWESGFNVILLSVDTGDLDEPAGEIAKLLGSEKKSLKALLEKGSVVPLARVESEMQASVIAEKLAEFGVRTLVVADDTLQPNTMPTRLRSVRFDNDDEIILEHFNTGETRRVTPPELSVIVTGIILARKAESIDRRKRGISRTIRETETLSDEPVIDIYSSGDPIGWRIPAHGFDFSCLGPEKSLTVSQNMKTLIAKLSDFSPMAKLIDNYTSLRSTLEFAWPTDSRRETEVLGMDGKEISSVVATNNIAQFTRYSRLQWRLNEEKI